MQQVGGVAGLAYCPPELNPSSMYGPPNTVKSDPWEWLGTSQKQKQKVFGTPKVFVYML